MTRIVFFRDIRVFDGARVIDRTDVVVTDGRITAVGPRIEAPAAAQVVEGTGRTLLPGLIDAHVHITDGASAQAMAFGITTQLDMFADPQALPRLRKESATRDDLADLRSAGTGATVEGGHPSQMVEAGLFPPFPTVNGPQEAGAFVANRIAEGSDYLKIFASGVPGEPDRPQLTAQTIAALIRAAHGHGVLALAHATDTAAAFLAIRGGADGLAHLPFDRPLTADEVTRLADSGAFVIPTLTMVESFCQVRGGARLAADPRVRSRLSPQSTANLESVMEPAPTSPRYAVRNAVSSVLPLAAAGVTILAGTDALAPGTAHGASLHRELELLVDAGLSATAALAAATSASADRFGLADRGRIRLGLRADLVVTEGDPTRFITDSRSIVEVFRAGVPLGRPRAVGPTT